jgi:hypothetical protein
MTMDIDVNERRAPAIALNGLTHVDDAYTFYYDETNNPRRLHVTADGFNVEAPLCFVLGGVAHRGAPRPLDITGLRQTVRLQTTAKELKRENLGKGDFLQLLGMWKVEALLDWVAAEGLLIHYIALDPLYWGLVDIIDSVISHDHLAHMQAYHWQLKNDLFTVLAADWADTAELLHRYDYPDVGRADRAGFVGEVRDKLEDRQALLADFNYQVLKGVLDAGRKVDQLFYLEDETPNTLIDSFSVFFIDRLCLFKNAQHRLDVEEVIQAKLAGFRFMDGPQPLHHFGFVDSTAEPGVQVSDCVVGLLGKLFSYASRTEPAQIIADRRALKPGQVRTLAKLKALIDRSQAETAAMTQQVGALRSMQAAEFFIDGA